MRGTMRGRLGWRRRGGSLGSEQASQMNSAQQDVALLQCLPNTCTVPMLTCYLHCSSVYPILALFQCLPNTCTVLMFSCSGIAHKTNLYWYNTRGNALLCCTGIVHRNTITLVQHMRLILHWYNIAGGVYCIGSWYSTRD